MTLKSQDKNEEWNNIMWIVFKMQTGFKKRKDWQWMLQWRTNMCVSLPKKKKNVQETQDIPTI